MYPKEFYNKVMSWKGNYRLIMQKDLHYLDISIPT